MKVLVTGGDGKLSAELKKIDKENEYSFLGKTELDITFPNSISICLERYQPDVLLHSGGLTRPMVDHELNPEKSILLNIIGTANCVRECIRYGTKIVYISTDYVYPGEEGNYSEEDGLLPVNKYAWSKLGGECSVMMYDNSLIIRPAIIEYPFPHKQAFTDSLKSCIWNFQAASIIDKLISLDIKGIVNVGGESSSIYDFVTSYNIEVEKAKIPTSNKSTARNSSLDLNKLNKILND